MTHLAERVHQLHPGPMKGLDASSTRIVTGGSDGAVRLLARNGEHIAANSAHHDVVNDVALAPDHRVVSASRDRTIRLFDPQIGRSYVIGEHDHWAMAVTWSDDGTRIASGSEDGTVGFWAPEGASVTRVSLGRPVNGIDWRNDVVAAVTGDGALHLLDPDGTAMRTVDDATQISWDVALSPAADRAAWVGRDRMLRVTTVESGATVAVAAHTDQIWGVAWDATGDRILSVSADGTCAIWTPLGEAVERTDVGIWVRRGRFRGVELYLATEDGGLAIFSDDGLPAATPAPIEVPDEPPDRCSHWDPRVKDAGPRPRCRECGSTEEARLCVTCGYVGCCESQLAHATKHWVETGHPNTIPVPVREFGWRWCYADDMYVKRV